MLAPIAKRRRKANDLPMRILRITAWVVALATYAIFAGVMLGSPNLPSEAVWAYASATVALAPATVGLLIAQRQPRNVIAWILLVGALSAAPFYVFIPDEGWVLQCSRALWPLLYAWPIARRVRVPERPAPDPSLALGRDRRGGLLRRLHLIVALLGPGAVRPARRRRFRARWPAYDFPDCARVDLGAALARHPRLALRRCDRDPAAAAPLDGRRAAADALARLGVPV